MKRLSITFLCFVLTTNLSLAAPHPNCNVVSINKTLLFYDTLIRPISPVSTAAVLFNNNNLNKGKLQTAAVRGGTIPDIPLSENGTVIFSSGNNSIEFTPSSSFNNGLLIEPINRAESKGVSTAFYLSDTSSWKFYTDAQNRLTINGKGTVITSSAMLINNADDDNSSALRVNGMIRSDSAIEIRSGADSASFISIHRNVKSAAFDPDDRISPYTTTPTSWAAGNNLPVFRIRHPNSMVSQPDINTSVNRDFLILPYQYGMAIEYNGVVECWVGEWSIHKGLHYNDTEGKGNGWGGVLWVGDDVDEGGVRATARDNRSLGGNVNYGELSVEKFNGASNGDLRLRLPSVQNNFQFVYGERGSENIVAKLTNQGLIIPKISSVAAAQNPEKGQLVYDSSTNSFKGYNGTGWARFSELENTFETGSYTVSSTGSEDTYLIPHGLNDTPGYYNVIATSPAAANISYVTADDHNLIIHYNTPPSAGLNNLSWNWQVKR